jgi:hypothetical protein
MTGVGVRVVSALCSHQHDKTSSHGLDCPVSGSKVPSIMLLLRWGMDGCPLGLSIARGAISPILPFGGKQRWLGRTSTSEGTQNPTSGQPQAGGGGGRRLDKPARACTVSLVATPWPRPRSRVVPGAWIRAAVSPSARALRLVCGPGTFKALFFLLLDWGGGIGGTSLTGGAGVAIGTRVPGWRLRRLVETGNKKKRKEKMSRGQKV